jgi:hypothetical protein
MQAVSWIFEKMEFFFLEKFWSTTIKIMIGLTALMLILSYPNYKLFLFVLGPILGFVLSFIVSFIILLFVLLDAIIKPGCGA